MYVLLPVEDGVCLQDFVADHQAKAVVLAVLPGAVGAVPAVFESRFEAFEGFERKSCSQVECIAEIPCTRSGELVVGFGKSLNGPHQARVYEQFVGQLRRPAQAQPEGVVGIGGGLDEHLFQAGVQSE